jgi:hypothetical protein
VLGESRGGELTLLLGATFPAIRAVVAYVPSGVLWMGIPVGSMAQPEPPPAWTWHGGPLPFMRGGIVGSAVDWPHPPVALAPGYVAALDNCRLVEQAAIPVEKTQGPLLLISGQADRMSLPCLAEIAVRRAQQHHVALSRGTCELSPGRPSPDVTVPANDAAFQTASDPAHRRRL